MKIKKNTWRYYFIHVYQHSSWYDLQFLTYRGVWQTEICNYGSFFALPPKNQKNLNFEKIHKITGDIIILHKCTKNHNNMRYSSWDTEWDRHLDYFLPFYPSKNPKNQNFEKMIKMTIDITLRICTINENHMMYDSWNMKCNRQHFLSFWVIFCPFYPTNNPKNPDFEKNGTNTWRYRVTQVYQKSWSYVILFLRYGA